MNHISSDKMDELKKVAKLLAVMGVRNNTDLEELHAGITPSSKTGDYSDVKVIRPTEKLNGTGCLASATKKCVHLC